MTYEILYGTCFLWVLMVRQGSVDLPNKVIGLLVKVGSVFQHGFLHQGTLSVVGPLVQVLSHLSSLLSNSLCIVPATPCEFCESSTRRKVRRCCPGGTYLNLAGSVAKSEGLTLSIQSLRSSARSNRRCKSELGSEQHVVWVYLLHKQSEEDE